MLVDLIKRWQPAPKSSRWEDYFHGNEELLWSAAPLDTPQITLGMVAISIFGLPFLIAGVMTFGAGMTDLFSFTGWSHLGTGLLQILFSLPFLIVGGAFAVGTWVMASLRPHFMRYAVSNKRAYIASSWWTHKMESYPICADNHIELIQGKSDTVYFIDMHERDNDGDRTLTRIGFEHIADGATVYTLLRDLQQKALT